MKINMSPVPLQKKKEETFRLGASQHLSFVPKKEEEKTPRHM